MLLASRLIEAARAYPKRVVFEHTGSWSGQAQRLLHLRAWILLPKFNILDFLLKIDRVRSYTAPFGVVWPDSGSGRPHRAQNQKRDKL